MNTYVQQRRDHQARANGKRAGKASHERTVAPFGHHAATLAQRKLDEALNASPGVASLTQLRQSLNQSPQIVAQAKRASALQTKSAPVQRQDFDEEELMQGKFAAVQRQGDLEEEELLQGKFAAAQRQGDLEEEELLQGKFSSGGMPTQLQSGEELAENRTGLPDPLKSGLEQLSGMDLSDVRVHRNSAKPAQLNALAYAQGQDIHLGPGQEQHLPHEGWHAVQQMQGRVRPTTQLQGVAVNDDSALEREADVMGQRASTSKGVERPVLTAGTSLSETKSLQRVSGPQMVRQRKSDDIVQCRQDIVGSHAFGNGTLSVNFEERVQGSSAGEYGTIKFEPDPNGEKSDMIELTQIASLKSNKAGQKQYLKEEGGEPEQEEHLETSGEQPIKDLLRIGSPEQFFVDQLGLQQPRTELAAPTISAAYNVEKRTSEKPGERLDIVAKGKQQAKVYNNYDVIVATNQAGQELAATASKLPDYDVRKISQKPGCNKGGGDVRATELHDFPVSNKPCIFSFHTAVEAEREGRRQWWGTVKWGFGVLKDVIDDQCFVHQVTGPDFVEGTTDEVKDAVWEFDAIMQNPRANASLEALKDAHNWVDSDDRQTQQRGEDQLWFSGRDLQWTLSKIVSVARSHKEGQAPQLKAFLKSHLPVAGDALAGFKSVGWGDGKLGQDLQQAITDAKELLQQM